MTRRGEIPFPTADEVESFIRGSAEPPSLREIARAFHLRGAGRERLKTLLREMAEAGRVPGPRRLRAEAPRVAVLVVETIDRDGVVTGRPLRWPEEPAPLVRILATRGPAPGPADRVLARLDHDAEGDLVGHVLRRLEPLVERQLVAVLRGRPGRAARLEPVDRREREDWPVEGPLPEGVADGDLVLARVSEDPTRRHRRATVLERIGPAEGTGAFSLIAIHGAGIPVEFPPAALAEAAAARPVALGARADLRDLPLVTIDGADARDFDDAVFAQPDPEVEGGWHLVVAIADVAHYVTPGSALDRAACERGNSVYLPDRVVPMLPEALSNGLCSLRPGEERACLAAQMWIDAGGRLRRHRFVRGLMRSAARLTYEQVQAARDGTPDTATAPLVDGIVTPLYGAFAALLRARAARGTLELDLPERVVRLDPDGRVVEIGVRPRLDSHRLIEEFMIAANVAAAETLETARVPTLYRVHDQPDAARLDTLREALTPLGYRLARGTVPRPAAFIGVLERARGRPEEALVSEMVLRAQAQAVYAPDNLGHFGLALPRYAHFTSPIRRYADLVVHRGLIGLLGLGADGTPRPDPEQLATIGRHVSMTERRAALAERDATDRFAAAWLESRLGEAFEGRISGAARFGLFVAVEGGAASGLVPIESLPDDYYDHDPASGALVGRRWGRVFRMGASVRVRLAAVEPLSGRVTFALLDAKKGADLPGLPAPQTDRPRRGRGPPRRGR